MGSFNRSLWVLGIKTSQQMFAEDPYGFTAKVLEKIRNNKSQIVSRTSKIMLQALSFRKQSQIEELFNQGEITKGISASRQSSRRRSIRARARLEEEKLSRLNHNFRHGVPMRKSTRVLHYLTNSLPYTNSGYTMRTQKVLKAQSTAGVSVQGVTRIGYPLVVGAIPKSDHDVVEGIVYSRILPLEFPSSLRRRDELTVMELVKQAREFRADALQTTTDFTNAIVVSEAAAILGIPWIYEVRGELESTWASRRGPEAIESEFYKLARAAETRAMEAASHVITLSEIYKQEAVSRGISPEKITVVPNAIDDEQLNAEISMVTSASLRKELGIADDQKLIGTMTSVVSYEGLDTLIKALDFLPSNITVLIVGEGTEKPALEKLATGKQVVFAGKKSQDEIMDWYGLLDVFVIPRKDLAVTRKVTPIKGLQAQALGIPIVASDLPALKEVTGGNEVYVEPENPEALARGVLEALRQANTFGKEWAAKRTWSSNGERYAKILGVPEK